MMYIESLDITDFGFFTGVSVDLKDGLNLVEGKNESGKSTVADFIRFILYGFSGKSDRDRHIKLTSNSASGSMIIRDGDKRYRIERRVAGTKDTCGVYDLSDGSQCCKGQVPGEFFFGLPEGLFDGTVFVGQAGGSRIDGKTTSEAVDNLLFSADESVNIKKALKKLDDARVELLYKNEKGGKIFDLSNKISDLRSKLAEASEQSAEIISLEGAIESLDEKVAASEAEREKLEFSLSENKRFEARKRRERLSLLNRTWNRKERELEDFRKNHTRNGYFPDENYYENVRIFAQEYTRADTQVKETEAELERLSEEMRQAQIERDEINRKATEKCHQLSSKKSGFLAVAVIGCILFMIMSGAAVYFFAKQSGFAGAVFAVIAVVSLAAMIYGFLTVSKCVTEIRAIESGMETDDDMRKYRLDQIRSDLEKSKNERSRCKTMLTDICSKWGYDQPARLLGDLKAVLEEEKSRVEDCEKSRFEYVNFNVFLQTSGDDTEDDGSPINLPADFDAKEAEKRLKLVSTLAKSNQDAKHGKEVRLASLSAKVLSPSSIEEQITAREYELEKMKSDYKAYVLAENTIKSASEKIRTSVSPRLSQSAGKYMGLITDGKYDEIGVDSRFGMTFRPEVSGGRITADKDYMSVGTSDAAYVSLRLSLAELICEGKIPPMIFDESFSKLDDLRLGGMFDILTGCGTQTIVFTPSDRERRILDKMKKSYNSVTLS